MTVEREVKLAVARAFRLPPLDALVDSATAVARPRREVEATYYDTADLSLIRSGVTLRHRTGEPGAPWTVKLPGATSGQTLERPELTFTGPAAKVPVVALDLVRAYARGRALSPVATVQTARDPVEIRAPDGTVLAEVVDDAVTARVGSRVRRRFREIEIEAKKDGPRAAEVLSAALERVMSAPGYQEREPLSKVVRALGARAARPADVVLLDLGPHPTIDAVARHAVAGSVLQLLRRDPLVRLGEDEEGVHKFRVATRRVRSDLETFADHLHVTRAATLLDDLRWLGTVVGGLRDKQVLAGNLRRALQTLPADDQVLAAPLLERLEGETSAARRAMLTALRGRRYLRLLDQLVRLSASRPPRSQPAKHGGRSGAAMARRRWSRLAAAVDALGTDPSDAAMHQVRIKAKRSRYTVEALAPLAGKRAERLAEAISDFQTTLGEHQDTVVAEAWLRDAAAAVPAARLVAGELIAHQRAERARLRSEWPSVWNTVSRKRLRAWL